MLFSKSFLIVEAIHAGDAHFTHCVVRPTCRPSLVAPVLLLVPLAAVFSGGYAGCGGGGPAMDHVLSRSLQNGSRISGCECPRRRRACSNALFFPRSMRRPHAPSGASKCLAARAAKMSGSHGSVLTAAGSAQKTAHVADAGARLSSVSGGGMGRRRRQHTPEHW